MKNLSRFILATIAPTALAVGAISQSDAISDKCRVKIKGYHHATVWEDARVRILVEAGSACGTKPGGLLELENVKLTIESGSEKIARLHSHTGLISQNQGKFVMGETFGPIEPGSRIPLVSTLLVDFKTHSIRSPQGIYLDLKPVR